MYSKKPPKGFRVGVAWKVFGLGRNKIKLRGLAYALDGRDVDRHNPAYPHDVWLDYKDGTPGFCAFTTENAAERYIKFWSYGKENAATIAKVHVRGVLTIGSAQGVPDAFTCKQIYVPSTQK